MSMKEGSDPLFFIVYLHNYFQNDSLSMVYER